MSENLEKKTYGIVQNPLNIKLIAELKNQNENVILFPSLITYKKQLTAKEIEILKNIIEFDWLIITDVYAADYLINALSETETDYFDLDNLTICVQGEAVADRLRFVQIHSDIIPFSVSDDFVLEAILQFADGDLEGSKIAIVHRELDNFSIIQKLKNKNAFVTDLPIYQAELNSETSKTKLKALLNGGAIDEFIISQPEDLLSLDYLTEKRLNDLFNDIRISATSEIAYQTIQEYGFRPLYFHL